MFSTPRAVPRSSEVNHAETSRTLGTNIPAPKRPARNLEAMANATVWLSPNSMVDAETPRTLRVIVGLLPLLSASMPQGIWPSMYPTK